MVEVRLAANIISLVLAKGKTYLEALDEIFPEERKTFQSSNVAVLLAKDAIRHYYLFENIVNENKIQLTSHQKALLYIVLANAFYTHVMSTNNCASFIKGEIPASEFKKIEPLLKRKEPLEELISFEKDSNFYFATKYNVPIWLVHMWRKHYGDELVTDFLESSNKLDLQTYIVNNIKTNANKLMLKYPDLSSPFEDVLIYNGTKRYNLTPEFQKNEYVDCKIIYKSLIDDAFSQFQEVLIYSGYEDDFLKAAIIKTKGSQGINIAVPDLDKRVNIMRFLRTNELHNVNLFEAKDEYSMKAGVSYKQDLVIDFPKSSRFDIVSKYPDFLLHVDRDSLDELINEEKESLELCSKFVNDGGMLIYLVNTLNKKESVNIIVDFLERHPEFSLEKDEQLISSHPFSTTVYYAFMINRGNSND